MVSFLNASVKQPLNVGALLSQVFSVFFRNFPILFAISLVPNFLMILIYSEMTVWGEQSIDFYSGTPSLLESGLSLLALILIALISYILVKNLTMLVAKDVTFKSRMEPIRYLKTLVRTLPVMLLTAFVVLAISFVVPFAVVFFVVSQNSNLAWLDPLAATCAVLLCLYLLARFYVFMPAILIGGDGVRAVYRASNLSKGHRWPIAVCLVVLFAIVYLVLFALLYFSGLFLQLDLIAVYMETANPTPLSLGIDTFLSTISTMLGATFSVLLYSRLRELKEGLGLADIAVVFE